MPVNIINYHYVRDNEEHFFDTYSRRKNEFESQIDFFLKDSIIIDARNLEELKYYFNSEENAYLITFDDGYKDHLFCAEYLASKNVNGYFFAPIDVIDGKLLDVNAIHILLGSRKFKRKDILDELLNICQKRKYIFLNNGKKITLSEYLKTFRKDVRFDDRDTLLLKRILQRDLFDTKNRKFVLNHLMNKFVNQDTEYNYQLYLKINDIYKMKKLGMVFGSHGSTHRWLNSLSLKEQSEEILESFRKLNDLEIVLKNDHKALCFPYGGYDKNTINIMKNFKIDIGFTSKPGVSKIDDVNTTILNLPRWDTNDWWFNEWKRPCKPF